MQSIKVTFPKRLSPEFIKRTLEENMILNSTHKVLVKHEGEDRGEELYTLSSEGGPMAFYGLGMAAAVILEVTNKHLNK